MAVGIKCPLSNEFKVACEIYKAEIEGESIWSFKLFCRLEEKLDERTISNALDTLFDWGIIWAECGPTEAGRSGRLLKVDKWHQERIKELYERYWREA